MGVLSHRHPFKLLVLTLLLLIIGAACSAPFDTINQLLDGPPRQAEHLQDIQLSPPPEILPNNGQAREDPTPTGIEPGSTAAGMALESDVSPTITPTPTITLTLPPGTQPLTPTFTASPSASPSTTLSPTITNTLPPGITPSRTATFTRTATLVFTPTRTHTATTTPTSDSSPPPPPTATDTPEPTAPPVCNPSGNGSFESALIALINQERLGRGLGPLSAHGQLTTAARNHSADMACNGFFSHTGSDGSMPWDRVSALGYSYSAIAENIFAGSSHAQTAFDAWMNSPGHRDNMLNPNYTEIGIGYRYWAGSPYGAYTTAVFARPR